MLLEKSDQMDRLLEQTAKALATTTEYTAMVSSPKGGNRIKFLQLSRVDADHMLVRRCVERIADLTDILDTLVF